MVVAKTTPRVLVPIDKIVQVTENHGGYEGGVCLICDAGGWIDGKYGYKFNARDVMGNRLKHKVSCAMNNYALDRMEKP